MKIGAVKTPAFRKIVPVGIIILTFLAGLAGFFFSSKAEVLADFDNKVQICHATSSEENPYNQQNVSRNSTAQGHDVHLKDIIPPFTYWVWEKVGSHQGCPNSGYGDWAPGKTCQKWISRQWRYAYPITIDDNGWVEHQYPGKNWDAQGQAIWENDCQIPDSTPTPTPTPTPTEEASPTPTPTSTPEETVDVCANIDGIQTSVPDGKHLDASGLNCVEFQFGGPPPPPPAEPTGQVLGATTLGVTGAAEENIFLALFALGSILSGVGVRKLTASKR